MKVYVETNFILELEFLQEQFDSCLFLIHRLHPEDTVGARCLRIGIE